MAFYPLEDFYRKASQAQSIQPQMTNANFDQFNRSAFKQSIPYIDEMDDHNLTILIKNNIDVISEDILHDDPVYAQILTNQKFISAFIRAINSIPIDYAVRLACNKITYDYFTSDHPDFMIKQQYLNLSKTVNHQYINKLISIGLDETVATNLAICRFSSVNEKTNVKRLNFAIYNRDPSLMTEQMVVWIYEKLFTRISDLFQATMFEVYNQQQQIEFGDNFMEVYGTVGLAVLCILNNMTSDNIRKVLIGYEVEWSYEGKPPVRFSLHALSNDYSRISRVVEYLNSTGRLIP